MSGFIALGLVGSWVLADAIGEQEADRAGAAMDLRVQVVESAVAAEVRRYVETSMDLAAAIGAQSDLSAADFTALNMTLTRERLPGTTGTSLVVPAAHDDIPRLQRDWRARGNPDLVLSPFGSDDDHLFVVLNHPLDGIPVQTGRDVSEASEPTEALAEARSRDQVTASATYVLLKDRERPTTGQQQSFVLAAPIVGAAETANEGVFLGWLLLGMRGRDFLDETMARASQDAVAVTLTDDSTPTTEAVLVAGVDLGNVVEGTGLERTVTIPVAGRTWRLLVQPTEEFMSSLGPSRSTRARNAGVLFTLLLAVLLGTLSTSRQRALAKVDRATAALRADIGRREEVEAALRAREEELHVMALTDSLTGLANRRAFMEALDRAHSRAVRHGTRLSVLFCDIDHFKTVNDTFGHAAGDAVLREVASRLRQHFRTEDTIGRLGGDEFAVICEDGADFTQVLLDRLRDALAEPHRIGGALVAAPVSVGLASPRDGETGAQLLERADSTMYRDKAQHTLT
ncbi:sensor domain-containing diguanylate cyclase [Nocardioides sp.]|uniref:sensor domain-containing diguanylate cyclase n=1 Tax=Nocardioides sp. TaxID=35761 RepID=UPI001A34895F|nr:sensor domain-containing diguanylate cyclase [Nocardioides sp.]MBJ7356779.1 sensor domain-containing diguanylate cyclase [Nocardioides sp.]